MKTGKTLIAIAAATLIPFGAAMAGDKEKSGSMGTSFDTLDANRDGRISQVEASADTTIMFTSADKNGDGYLDKSEWKGKDKDKTGTTPQTQSMPDSTDSTDTVPQPAQESEPTPDTETPRQ
jgi:Ca2+-binding EF-hand superfamily protein